MSRLVINLYVILLVNNVKIIFLYNIVHDDKNVYENILYHHTNL